MLVLAVAATGVAFRSHPRATMVPHPRMQSAARCATIWIESFISVVSNVSLHAQRNPRPARVPKSHGRHGCRPFPVKPLEATNTHKEGNKRLPDS